jgi:hypothetical protein
VNGRAKKKVIESNVWANEPVPLIRWKNATQGVSENNNKYFADEFSMIHEYPLDGNRRDDARVLAENKEDKRYCCKRRFQKRL